MHPKISVVVPVYNVEKYLKKCLSSLEHQTLDDFEAIVVDDGSSDSSLEIAMSFQQRDSRFRVLSQSNAGLGGARNSGIAEAKGEFLFMLDSDDYIRNDTFQSLVGFSEKHDLDILVFNYDRVTESGDIISTPEFSSGVISGEDAFKKVLSLKTSPQACNKLYKTSLFSDNAIRFPENFLHEDIAVSYKLFWLADKVGYLNTSYYYWVIREGSITSDFNYQHINDLLTSLSNIKQHLIDHSAFESHTKNYAEGCVKMLNLMMERATAHQRNGCLDYLLFLIDQGRLITKEQIQSLEGIESSLLLKFRSNYKRVSEQSEATLSSNEVQPSQRTNVISKVGEIAGRSIPATILKQLYKLSYVLFPLDSPRRETLKKILRKIF